MNRPALDERLERLGALAEALEARRSELVDAVRTEFHRTRPHAEGEVDLALRRLRAFGDVVCHLENREPVGAVAVVLPANAALSNPSATIGTAFLAGNRVLPRFPNAAGGWAARVEPLFEKHLPGVRFDHRPARTFLREILVDPDVRVTMIFGDDSWVDAYEPLVREHRKKLIFEGPGNDPFLVLDGADVERAARDAVRGAYYNAGQACTSPERFYVLRGYLESFTRRVVELTREEVVGDLDRDGVTIGPIVNSRIVARIAAQFDEARSQGARFLTGGRIEPTHAGGSAAAFVYPTVVTEVDSSMSIMRDETFGPVIAIQAVETPEEALGLASDSPYGLAANVYGGNGTHREALAEAHGQVFSNEIWLDYFSRHLHAPYGGRKRSGWVWEWRDGRFARRDGSRVNAVEFSRSSR